LLAPCGATAKHGNYYSGKFMFFKLEKKYLLAGVIMLSMPGSAPYCRQRMVVVMQLSFRMGKLEQSRAMC
jgi:hypothetical protein